MDKLKYIKLENEDGTYSDSIPLAVDSNHVDVNGNTLTNELAKKANVNQVNEAVENLSNEIMSLASGSPKGVYTTINALVDANPATGVYIVTTDGHIYSWTKNASTAIDLGLYQTTGIAEDSIEPKHTTFIDKAINYFDKDNAFKTGLFYADGSFHPSTTIGMSNIIPCSPGDKIRATKRADGNNTIIAYLNNAGVFFSFNNLWTSSDIAFGTDTVPNNAVAFSVSYKISEAENFMITINQSYPTYYIPFIGYKDTLSDIIQVNQDSISELKIADSNIDYNEDGQYFKVLQKISKNKFNKNNLYCKNKFYHGETHQWRNYENIHMSNIIECNPGDKIRFTKIDSDIHIVYMDKNKNIIGSSNRQGSWGDSEYGLNLNKIVTAPENCYYFMTSIYNSRLDEYMITVNEPYPNEYVPYIDEEILLTDRGKNLASLAFNENLKKQDYFKNRVLVWEDDFNGDVLDETNWTRYERENHNDTLGYYTADEKNSFVRDSNLVIKAIKEDKGSKHWTTGWIRSLHKIEFRYGRVEAKVKMPRLQGTWPAFWTMGSNYDDYFINGQKVADNVSINWPKCGEIDIFEQYNKVDKIETAIHYYGGTRFAGEKWVDVQQWHVYAMEWTEKKMEFSVDGVVYAVVDIEDLNAFNNCFNLPQFLQFDLAIGGINGQTEPESQVDGCEMLVDWVRIYAPCDEIKNLELNKHQVTISLNDENREILNVDYSNTNETMTTVLWESSDDEICKVFSGGLLPISTGECIITVTNKNGYSDSCQVTVTD